jgi:small GTP-binding protein
MQGEWIRRPQGAAASAVFVHGILSSGETCWRNDNGCFWPELLKNEPELGSLGIYVFTYETGIFSGSYRLGDVVDALKEHVRLDGVLESKQLIFLCHSMGGIVVRKFIVERAIELIGTGKEIDLFLIASPSLGSSYADWLSPLAQLFGHAQADALRFVRNNSWLMDLDKEFLNLKESGRLKIRGKELVEDKFVVLPKFLGRQVVESFSGARYFGERYKVAASDHFSIAKPADAKAIQHRLLRQFIFENALSPRVPASESPSPQPVENKRSLNEGKLILVGRGGVGKTSLVQRLVENRFRGDEPETQGINITNWPLLCGPEALRLNIWDFGGKEIMHATHRFFLTQRSLYIIVLNGREDVEDLDAEYWLQHIEGFGGDSPVIVVQNKIRQHPFDLNYRGLRARYPQISGFVKTDCKEGFGLEELREVIQKAVTKLPTIRMQFPMNWFNVKAQVESMTSWATKVFVKYAINKESKTIMILILYALYSIA